HVRPCYIQLQSARRVFSYINRPPRIPIPRSFFSFFSLPPTFPLILHCTPAYTLLSSPLLLSLLACSFLSLPPSVPLVQTPLPFTLCYHGLHHPLPPGIFA